jgi:hypothetical protein
MEIRALYTTKPPKCALTCLGDLAADHIDQPLVFGFQLWLFAKYKIKALALALHAVLFLSSLINIKPPFEINQPMLLCEGGLPHSF